ncbi:hypothetical protein [Paenibacillus koleovorans]|uniref:hypothetical protein n=1 Tax=Paenibacillus koleovorans TaxID=121608 RepID=UPI000FD77E2B|nr:hypothetical protein [Paenibacillus koleovorans]
MELIESMERIAALLGTPGLEPETAKLLNETLRSMIQDYSSRGPKPVPPEGNQAFIHPSVFAEWLNGAQAAERGDG